MRHLPESGFGLHVYDLFLQAVIAGNSHGDVRRLHLYLWHDRPPASSCNFRLSASIESDYLLLRITPTATPRRSRSGSFNRAFSAAAFVLNGFDKGVNSPSTYLKSSHCLMILGMRNL